MSRRGLMETECQQTAPQRRPLSELPKHALLNGIRLFQSDKLGNGIVRPKQNTYLPDTHTRQLEKRKSQMFTECHGPSGRKGERHCVPLATHGYDFTCSKFSPLDTTLISTTHKSQGARDPSALYPHPGTQQEFRNALRFIYKFVFLFQWGEKPSRPTVPKGVFG